ncbi:MAG: transposase [Clostridia bacterium]|jgi:site-specific DNA recombinase|nr:MAG: transposase [Clostridia bacterium]
MNKIIDQTFKVAIYLRLSKEDDDLSCSSGAKSESNSISNQRKLIYDFMKLHPELELYDEYKDDGKSGSNFDRAEFQRMMKDIEAGKVNCVVVKDQSRFGRDYIDVGKYKEKIFPKLGVRFITINEGYDSLSATSSDDLAFTINSFVYDFYIRDISTKIRTNLTAKKQNGEYAGAFVAYGYVKDSNDKSKLVVDQFAADVVRDIFRWKIEGLSPQNIAVRLNELGIPSPAEYKKLSGSNYKTSFQTSSKAVWSHVSVRRILKNEIYLGVMIQGKRTTPNYKTKTVVTKAESEWLRVEGTHEAIISVRDFELVQELLRDDTHCRAGDVTVPVYAGRIYCGDCGATAVRKTVSYAGKRYVYYVCNANKHDKTVCSRHSIREDILGQVIYQTVRHQIDLLLDVDKALRQFENLSWEKHKLKQLDASIEIQEEVVRKNNTLRLGIYEDLRAGLLDRSEYESLKKELAERIAEATAAIEKLNKEKREILDGVSKQQSWIEQFRQYENVTELTRPMVIHLIERINIFEDSNIEIVFRHRNQIEEILRFISEQTTDKKVLAMPIREVG